MTRQCKNLSLAAYPVGSIYMSVNGTSPATLFGGTWERLKGRFLIGQGPNDANTTDWWGAAPANSVDMPAGEMGGEYRHTLTVDEMPSHSHQTGINGSEAGSMNAGNSSALKWTPDSAQLYAASVAAYSIGVSQPKRAWPLSLL